MMTVPIDGKRMHTGYVLTTGSTCSCYMHCVFLGPSPAHATTPKRANGQFLSTIIAVEFFSKETFP